MPERQDVLMPRKTASPAEPGSFPLLAQETLYVGVDIGKRAHVAGFLSVTLLTRHQRFEHCPALSFDNSREGFRSLLDRIQTFVPLTQVQVLLEVTGHYHRALMQYLQNLDIPVYIIHVQKRREGLLKSDKRDALGLANQLYTQLEKGVQVDDPLQAVRQLAPPTAAAAQLRGMVHHHAELVAESTQRKNKLTSICDELFPEFTQLLRNPNLPTALALRSHFPTPAQLAQASFAQVREARGRTCSVSDAKLLELQRLAATSVLEPRTRLASMVWCLSRSSSLPNYTYSGSIWSSWRPRSFRWSNAPEKGSFSSRFRELGHRLQQRSLRRSVPLPILSALPN
jgi:transposase